MGAWIEIGNIDCGGSCKVVAPLVGAWIEILLSPRFNNLFLSLLSWERGLKSNLADKINLTKASLLSWERGLKYTCY